MVIPGNLPSQLCVLDSSQQLYALVFLASSQVQPILFPSKLPEKLLRSSTIFFFQNLPLFSRFLPFFLRSLSQPPFLSLYHAVTSNPLSKARPSAPLQCCHLQRSLQQLPFLLSHPRPLTACGTPF